MSEIQSYKIQKYLNKLQSVSQDHPSYQLYLSKYMYWLEGGGQTVILANNHHTTIQIGNKLSNNGIIYTYCGHHMPPQTGVQKSSMVYILSTTTCDKLVTKKMVSLDDLTNYTFVDVAGYLVKIKQSALTDPVSMKLQIGNFIMNPKNNLNYKFCGIKKDIQLKKVLYLFSSQNTNCADIKLEIPIEEIQTYIFIKSK